MTFAHTLILQSENLMWNVEWIWHKYFANGHALIHKQSIFKSVLADVSPKRRFLLKQKKKKPIQIS